ncbi:MAG: GAF domain-containing protein, partial [Spirochaetota bacterium]
MLLLPAYYYTQLLTFIQIYIFVGGIYGIYRAFQNKRKGARLFLSGIVVFFLLIVNDLLYYQRIVNTYELVPLGLIVFIVSQAVVLSMRFSSAFSQIEDLTENLEKKVESRTNEIKLLNDISKSDNSNLSFSIVIENIMKSVQKQFDIEICILSVVDTTQETVKPVYISGSENFSEKAQESLREIKLPLYDTNHVQGYVYQSQESLYTRELVEAKTESERKIIELLQLKSYLCIPVFHGKEVIGLLGFSNFDRVMELEQNDINFLEKVSLQVGSAIYNSNLLNQIEKQKRSVESLNTLLQKLNEKTVIEDVILEIANYMNTYYGFQYCGLGIADEGQKKLKLVTGKFPPHISQEDMNLLRSIEIPLDFEKKASIHTTTFLNKKPLLIKDAQKEMKTETGSQISKFLRHKSWLSIPLFYQNAIMGSLDCFHTEANSISDEQIKELIPLTEQLSGIINGFLLLEKIEKEKQETIKLNHLIKSLNEELDLKVIMKKVQKYAKEHFSIEHYGLYYATSDKRYLKPLDLSFPDHFSQQEREKILNFKVLLATEKGAHAFVNKTKKYFYIPNARIPRIQNSASEEELYVIDKYNTQSFLLLPLILNNELIGVLDMQNDSKRMDLSKQDITRLSILAEQLAGIIYGSNLFEQVQEEKEKAIVSQQETE